MKDQSSSQSPSNPTSSQPQLTPAQEAAQLRQQYQAVSELLWEAIHTMAPDTHEVTVAPHASNPLWELAFVRADVDGKPDPDGRMRICAATIPEMTEAEKKRVVRFLRDTSIPLVDALAKFKLPHPPTYVEARIADRIKWVKPDGTSSGSWESVSPPTIGEQLKKVIHWPK